MAKKKTIGKPFEKGDPRINRKGRPKSFDALRKIAREIAEEVAKVKGTDQPLRIGEREISVAEAILRQWATSSNPQLQRSFIEVAFGKVPEVKYIAGEDGDDIKVVLQWAKYDDERNND